MNVTTPLHLDDSGNRQALEDRIADPLRAPEKAPNEILTPYPDPTPPPEDETSRVLLRAAEIVRERWGQGFVYSDKTFCAGRAIQAAEGDDHGDWFQPSPAAQRFACSLGLPPRLGHIVNWNDEKGRTAEEVALALERAAIGA